MSGHRDNERGDTLVEILLAIVLIGLMMGVLFASITMAATGSNNHKNLATADALLRNYAEAAKTAVRDPNSGCGKAIPTTFSVPLPTAPAGFSVSSNPNLSNPQNCPSKTTGTGVLPVQLFVNVPNISAPKELDVGLRTP